MSTISYRVRERLTEFADFGTGTVAFLVLVDVGAVLFLLGLVRFDLFAAVVADQFFLFLFFGHFAHHILIIANGAS